MSTFAFVLLGALAAGNLVVNPEFGHEFEHWTTHPPEFMGHVSSPEKGAVRIELGASVPVDWRSLVQGREAAPGERFALTAEVRTRGMTDGGMYTVGMHFHDAEGARIGSASAFAFEGLGAWSPAICRGEAPPGTASIQIGLHTHGVGIFEVRALHLEQLPDAPAPPGPEETVTLTVTPEITVDALVGFGAEDDGWFYNEQNAARGVTAADEALRAERIEWMRPDWVRSFFWLRDWNPSMDLKRFEWDTDNMRSQYRTLDLYQRLGSRVTVAMVEWGWEERWADPEAYAWAVGELMEHLIVARGYDCIQDWTLTNEPNLSFIRQGNRWDTFVRLHELAAAEFERRGLDLNIVGSDDADNLLWFRKNIEEDAIFDRAAIYASHAYFDAVTIPFMGAFYRDRLELLRARSPEKPLVMAEYGFADARTQPPDINPFMEEFAFALLNHRAIIEGLNEGVAGFNIWCLSEKYYPGAQRPMNFGLWHFVDRDSEVRPVFHSMAAFTRHTRAGMKAWRVVSTHPGHVNAARVGNTLFWFNGGEHAQRIRVESFDLNEVRAYTAGNLGDERNAGEPLTLEGNAFTAPPRSFGYATP